MFIENRIYNRLPQFLGKFETGQRLNENRFNRLFLEHVQPKNNYHTFNKESPRSNRFKFIALTTGLGLTGYTMYLFNNSNRKKTEHSLINFADNYGICLPLLLVSKEHAVNELFMAVGEENFEKAKFLITTGKVDVNSEKRYWLNEENETLLERFYPTTFSELEKFKDFTNFALAHGYKHINRPIGGKPGACNLLINVYNTHIFSKDSFLRRSLISFFLEKGVDPLYKSTYLGSALVCAFHHNDGEFFINECNRLNINLNLKNLNEDDACELFQCCIENANTYEFSLLVSSGLKIPPKKTLLETLEKYSFRYSQEKLKHAQRIIAGLAYSF